MEGLFPNTGSFTGSLPLNSIGRGRLSKDDVLPDEDILLKAADSKSVLVPERLEKELLTDIALFGLFTSMLNNYKSDNIMSNDVSDAISTNDVIAEESNVSGSASINENGTEEVVDNDLSTNHALHMYTYEEERAQEITEKYIEFSNMLLVNRHKADVFFAA
ncbi:MAG: hypothetical protein V4482_04215 [Pseudomonadota bacterium]